MSAAIQLPMTPRAPAPRAAEVVDVGGVDEAMDGLVAGDAGADEDGQHDRPPCGALGGLAAQREGDAQRERPDHHGRAHALT
jgi:hypothetical protein